MSRFNFKVVLLGQGCVGKTSLVLRYVSNVFNDRHQSTLQASFLRKQLYLEQDLITLNIWDTAGQEKFHALGPIYYREANGALLVYDVTSPESLQKVRDWVNELNKMLGINNIKLAIIGNKIDLLSVSEQKSPQNNALIQEALQFTSELTNAKHYLVSAKLDHGIVELFTSLSKKMVEQYNRKLSDNNNTGARSRILKTLSVTDDDELNNNGSNNRGGRGNRGIDIGSTSERSNSCQC